MRAFVVDRSVVVRDRLLVMLSAVPGVDVVGIAAAAAEAIHGFRRLWPDVVVMDITTPGTDGIRAIRAIKKTDPSTVILTITHHPKPEHRMRCLAAGADYFLDKSTEFDRISALITQMSPAYES